MNIEVFINWNGTVNSFTPKFMNFSAGEVHISEPISIKKPENVTEIFILSDIKSSEDIMRTLIVTNAIKHSVGQHNIKISLIVPYLPYSRSDRVCAKGEEFGLELFAQLVNTQGYKSVITFDAHSSVSKDLINNLKEVKLEWLVSHYLRTNSLEYDILLSPDKGAEEKGLLCSKGTRIPVTQGFKVRDPNTGKLSGFGLVNGGLLTDKKVLMIDDLCDNGGTFLGLLKEVQVFKPKQVDLLVTHGIFGKGVEVLEEGGFHSVDAINYFSEDLESSDNTLNDFIFDIVRGDFSYE